MNGADWEEPKSIRDLSEDSLRFYPKQTKVPGYNRDKVGQAWVHFGVGNFHRAHQALYADDLFNSEGPSEWGIYGVGFGVRSKSMSQLTRQQDQLYSLFERSMTGDDLKIIGAIRDFRYAPDEMENVLSHLAAPTTKLVSLTITEKGYHTDETTGDLDLEQEQVKYDLEHFETPRYPYGFLVAALYRRYKAGTPPYTIMCCDNIQHNGNTIRKAVIQFAQVIDQKFADWIEQNGAFPNTMVDRIAPSFDDTTVDLIKQKYGVADYWPVVAEPFRVWVVEDKFSMGRPNFDKVGVLMVDDVLPYEKMKLNILNLSHSSVAYYGVLAGLHYVHDSMNDPKSTTLLDYIIDTEVIPILPPIQGEDPIKNKELTIERFRNEAIKDTLLRICMDGSGKVPKFIVIPIQEALEQGSPISGLLFVVATWFRWLTGENDKGEKYEINDPIGDKLKELAILGGKDPTPLLEQKNMFGDLVKNEAVVNELKGYLTDLYDLGASEALTKFLKKVGK